MGLDQIQANPVPFDVFGFGALNAVIWLKQVWEVFRRDADAVIFDQILKTVILYERTHVNSSALRRVFDRIMNQVVYRFSQLRRIPLHDSGWRRDLQTQRDTLLCSQGMVTLM